MSDNVIVEMPADDVAATEPAYADDDFNVFVDDAAAPVADEATTKLMAELKANQDALAKAQAAIDPVVAMRDGIAALGDRIAPRAPADVRIQSQQYDLKKLEEDFNKSVYDNPFQKTAELFHLFSQMTGAQQGNANLMYSKRIVAVDPATRDLYKRFQNEVEEEVAKAPPAERATNPSIYDDALTRVKARHMEELFAERLAEVQKVAPAAAAVQRQTPYAEGAGLRPAAVVASPATRKVVVSRAKMAEVEGFARDRMIPMSAALSYYERHGWLK